MGPIGGYFELELGCRGGNMPHSDGVMTNSGRTALEYVLTTMGVRTLYVPYYTCSVVLEPVEKLGILYEYYHIGEDLRIAGHVDLADGEFLLYTDYFGVMDAYVRELSDEYGTRLIVDAAQALYAEELDGVAMFFSPRKFVGIPDGGIAIGVSGDPILLEDVSYDRCNHLLQRIDEGSAAGYASFRENARKLIGQPVRKMSRLSRRLIESIDFDSVRNRRLENFRILHEGLGDMNMFAVPSIESFACPMVYPFRTSDTSLRARLIEAQVFVATYWPSVMEAEGFETEQDLKETMLAIPCDQRYGEEDMKRIISLIK